MTICYIDAEDQVTVGNLLAAVESELNAHGKCVAFAEKAEIEGLSEAACLFRVIGRSARSHANRHARVIRQSGGEPGANLHPIEVKTTIENLVALFAVEVFQIESMYPRFLLQNRRSSNSAAFSFTQACEADQTHARLLAEMIGRMAGGKARSQAAAEADMHATSVGEYVSRTLKPNTCRDGDHSFNRLEATP